MNILRTSRVALRALGRNKMRSFLTALGIIIGVGAVISMVSIGEGARRGVEDRFASMGTNLLFVSPGSRSRGGVHSGSGGWNTLKPEDAAAIEQQCDAVKYTSPSASTRAQVVYGNKNWNTSIQGTGAMYPEVRNWELADGTYFDESQVRVAAKVCVLGSEVKKSLFEDEDAVGKIIRVKAIPFRVIGVFKSKGESGGWFNRDDMMTVPYTTVMKRLTGQEYISSIDISAVSAARTKETQTQIEELMRIRHKIAPGAEDDFQVRNMSEIAEGAAQATQIMTILLGSIASISLLVGGIGIMNIMLVSVTERIREIGIRMAVGARQKDILLQFLTEAIVLSVLGGLIGVFFGIGLSKILHYVKIFSEFKTTVSPSSIIMAFGFSASVGIFFGFYPARKASRLDPIEALRYE
ncbi:MAG: multidrug ABC transporter substrate-binding protein [Candidatus Aminicenantes bacterium RBG_19FT_COMBO_58_17]|jgi:putative ABC transport system permease protein|nr:MAG: multidrug ABC transporter substrate-binding protein [Candidatus Aminicenantes bacterium RBG_19FT_COMBO_58_17]HCS48423.1 multidrug ABC transporter substrate-binding protein [Candidatus Aminicenantes bacterium]